MKTLLKVASILMIIGAGLTLLLGILLAGGSTAILSSVVDSSDTAGVAAIAIILGVLFIIGSVPSLLSGIFGLKSLGGKKGLLTAGLVLVIIGFVFQVISVIFMITSGDFSVATVIPLIVPILYIVGGISTRKEL